jgi:LuxR family maltose regulon positive regulatory protein
MGSVLLEWNDLDIAAQTLTRGIELCEQRGEKGVIGIGYLHLAKLCLAKGEVNEASTFIHQAELILSNPSTSILFSARIPFYQVRLWLAQGKMEYAIRWVQESKGDLPGYLNVVKSLVIVRVLLAQSRQGRTQEGENPLEEAQRLLDRVCKTAEADGQVSRLIEAWMLQSLLLREQGNISQSLLVLQQTLNRAVLEGYVRLFVDEGPPMAALLRLAMERGILPAYTSTLLEAFNVPGSSQETIVRLTPSSISNQELLEPLSERELEVLRLIADGCSNSDIARTLFLSIGTVKTHLKHIYGKLEAHTRTQAIARARMLHLLLR